MLKVITIDISYQVLLSSIYLVLVLLDLEPLDSILSVQTSKLEFTLAHVSLANMVSIVKKHTLRGPIRNQSTKVHPKPMQRDTNLMLILNVNLS
jgi:hypothetical protein